MNSRQRVDLALNHQESDRVPLDLGACAVTGMHFVSVYKLRQALGLDAPGTPVKIVEPYMLLGEIKPDLMDTLGVDLVGLGSLKTLFGFKNEGWKSWTFHDGTPALVPEGFNIQPESNGDILMYPEGDRSAPPSGRLPKGGWYFDTIVRQPPIDEDHLSVEDNLEEFSIITAEELEHFRKMADQITLNTDKAILANFGGTGFGDIALVPAPWLKYPKGIRAVDEWYMSTASRRDHVYKIFERQCAIGLANLEQIYQVVGNRVAAVFVTGTDFGTQRGPFISNKAYRSLFMPFHVIVNSWIHQHTTWKTFIHSCGSVRALIPDFIEAGFDILNPVQTSAAQMVPEELKRDFGDRITFWGGGVDTQHTLPEGTPDEVKAEVRQRIKTFGKGGGFIFNTVHNVQPLIRVENLIALYETVRIAGQYQ
jgi:hypothetical protein